jgi:pimeloyl-ACP methyl ester carboxylesterase
MTISSMLSNILRAIQTQLPRISEEGDDEGPRVRTGFAAALRKASIVFYTLALAAIIGWEAVQLAAPNGSAGKEFTLALTRGPLVLLDFVPPPKKEPRAIILFGSGDGGWTAFEEAVCKKLQGLGYEVVGIDFNRYAKTDYDLDILQADMGTIARTIRDRYADNGPPVILGGYSMGAAQAIAAAGGPHPPEALIGLLLIDPRSRGRYGLRLSDEGDLLPTGAGTFAVEEFARSMGRLRVAQWHAAEDSIDSRAWLQNLTAPHREFDFGQTGHYYSNGRADFLTQMGESVTWIFNPARNAVTSSVN